MEERRPTAVHEHEALVVIRPDHLALVDLPEHAFFLAKLHQTVLLPGLAVPVFIARERGGFLAWHPSQVDVRRIFRVSVGVDVITRPHCSDVTKPGLFLAIPPVL